MVGSFCQGKCPKGFKWKLQGSGKPSLRSHTSLLLLYSVDESSYRSVDSSLGSWGPGLLLSMGEWAAQNGEKKLMMTS